MRINLLCGMWHVQKVTVRMGLTGEYGEKAQNPAWTLGPFFLGTNYSENVRYVRSLQVE